VAEHVDADSDSSLTLFLRPNMDVTDRRLKLLTRFLDDLASPAGVWGGEFRE
jgi:hypothetical protein